MGSNIQERHKDGDKMSETLIPKILVPIISDMRFQKSKRYRRLKIVNYCEGDIRVMVDVDETALLTVTVFPATIEPTELKI